MEDPVPSRHISSMFRSPIRSRPENSRRRTARLVVAATLLTAACDNPTVVRPDFAYDPTELTDGRLYRWSTGARVRLFVEPMPAHGVDLALSVRRAVQSWNAVPQEREFTLEVVSSRDVAEVIVYDRSVAQPVVTGSCPFNPSGGAGYTYFCPLNGRAERLRPVESTVLSAAVVIRVDMTTTATQSALDALVAHEMGHAVGIGGHSRQTTDVMYSRPTVSTPTDRDRNTLRNLLGRAADITL